MVRLPDGTSLMVRGAGTSLRLRRGLSYGIPIRRRRRGIGFTSSGRGSRVGGTPMERKKRGVRQRRAGRCRDVGGDEAGGVVEVAGGGGACLWGPPLRTGPREGAGTPPPPPPPPRARAQRVVQPANPRHHQ